MFVVHAMGKARIITEMEDLAAGDHACLFYLDEREKTETASSFLVEGLKRGEKALCIAAGEVRSFQGRCVRGVDMDLEGCLERGRLAHVHPLEVYGTDGDDLEPRAVNLFWESEADRAASGGWQALRVYVDMSWALDRPSLHESLVACEAELNRLPALGRCVVLCAYHLEDFDPSLLLDVLRTHPVVIMGKEVLDNVYYVHPGEFLRNMVPGAVLAYHLSHLRERKEVIREIQSAREYAEAVVETIREPLLVLDENLRIIRANPAFYRTYSASPGETEGRLVYELGGRQWDIPLLRELLEQIIPRNTSFEDFEVEHVFPRLGHRVMLLNARRMHRGDDRTRLILLAIEDVTERRKAESRVRSLNRVFRGLGADFYSNMESVVHACKRILGGSLACYSRVTRNKMTMITTLPGEDGFLVFDDPDAFLFRSLMTGEGRETLVFSDLRGMKAAGDPLVERFGFRSYLGHPVPRPGGGCGVLSLYDTQARFFEPDDVETMHVLARLISVEEERL